MCHNSPKTTADTGEPETSPEDRDTIPTPGHLQRPCKDGPAIPSNLCPSFSPEHSLGRKSHYRCPVKVKERSSWFPVHGTGVGSADKHQDILSAAVSGMSFCSWPVMPCQHLGKAEFPMPGHQVPMLELPAAPARRFTSNTPMHVVQALAYVVTLPTHHHKCQSPEQGTLPVCLPQ